MEKAVLSSSTMSWWLVNHSRYREFSMVFFPLTGMRRLAVHVPRHAPDVFRELGKFRREHPGGGVPEIDQASGQILEAVPLQGDIHRMGHPHKLQRKLERFRVHGCPACRSGRSL